MPLWAERRHKTSWHPHHIAERYGLFAVILFGECIFAASVGVNEVVSSGGVSASLVATAAAALALVFALWWLYFLQEPGEGLAAHRDKSYVWGYGQYGLLSALAAVISGRLVLGGCLLILVVPALTGAAASLALIAAICAALVALTLTVTNRRPVWSYR